MKAVAKALGVSRSNLSTRLQEGGSAERSSYTKVGDEALLKEIAAIVDARGSYGYRRVAALLSREREKRGEGRVNHKRAYRVMKRAGLLLERHTGKSSRTHDGTIITLKSDLRWCSDCFEIRCWNGERVQVAFSLDCCDREVMAYVATTAAITGEMVRDLMAESVEYRFGASALARAAPPIPSSGSVTMARRTRPSKHANSALRSASSSAPRRPTRPRATAWPSAS